MVCTQGFSRPACPSPPGCTRIRPDAEQVFDEECLTKRIVLGQPSHSSFPNHMDRFECLATCATHSETSHGPWRATPVSSPCGDPARSHYSSTCIVAGERDTAAYRPVGKPRKQSPSPESECGVSGMPRL